MDLAVVLAGAGEGRRMGSLGPKLFLDIAGRSSFERVLDSFLAVDAVGEIVAVVPAALRPGAERALGMVANPRGIRLAAIAGGPARQESVRLGLDALARSLPFVAVHDVARVLVAPALIRRVLEAARATGAAIPAWPIHDSVKEVLNGRVARSIPREALQAAQTPQIFARDILARAHARAREENAIATDDSMLVERIGSEVEVVPGDPSNLKLTEPRDRVLLEALLRAGPDAGM